MTCAQARAGFHLHIEGVPNSEYWMHVEAPGDLSLADLDGFLRDIGSNAAAT